MNICDFTLLSSLAMIMFFTYPSDTVFLVLDPVYPVHAVGESELCYPLVSVLPPLCCYLTHSYQLPKVNLKPFFVVVSFGRPCAFSLTIRVYVKPGSSWEKWSRVNGRGRECSVWYMAIFQTERKGTAIH